MMNFPTKFTPGILEPISTRLRPPDGFNLTWLLDNFIRHYHTYYVCSMKLMQPFTHTPRGVARYI
jgi:hypothetical protein